eukprot:5905831-Pyramimonas_sp.AAC.1
MPKQRKSRCANQPPADVSALFGPTAASVHMAKLAAIEAGAETGQTGVTGGAQAQPQQGQRKKKCSCQHLLRRGYPALDGATSPPPSFPLTAPCLRDQ